MNHRLANLWLRLAKRRSDLPIAAAVEKRSAKILTLPVKEKEVKRDPMTSSSRFRDEDDGQREEEEIK